jgi:chromosome segregation protein
LYLKRLEIKGFKSFADNTELLLEPGINVIVGPNGCGKSNIADAIRWVLGEANVRHLRGQKNEDIIFNGTDKQKAQSMALVDMTIDNACGELPVDYREVTIGRRLFRNGESEYLLNKSKVRMKDIVGLFTGTGLGKRGYSLIGQGELEQVLNGQPFDRRLILEEASGTIKYRQQRDEVKQRLSSSVLDLQRVTDIMGEMEIHAAELSKKAARAEKYILLRDQFGILDRELIAVEIRDSQKNLAARTDDVNKKKASAQVIQQRLQDLDAHLAAAEQEAADNHKKLGELKEKKYQLEAEYGQSEADIKLITERIKNLQERYDNAVRDAQKYAQMLDTINSDLEKHHENLKSEEMQWQQRQLTFAQLQSEIKSLETTIHEQEEVFAQQRLRIFEQAQQESELKNNLLSTEEKLKQSREKKERLLLRLEDSQAKIKQAEQKLHTLQEQKQSASKHLQELRQQMEQVQTEYQTISAQLEKLETQEQIINRNISELNNKLLGLKDLERKYYGYSEGVKAVLEAKSRGEKKFQGIKDLVARIIDVPAGMETAIEAAVGKGLENIVAATMEDAREAIYFLKRKGLGRVTFLPLDGLRVQKLNPRAIQELKREEGVLGLASQLVSFDEEYEKAIEYLLGKVLLVSDLERGMQVFRHTQLPLRIVSLDGEIINVSGAMTGGSAATRSGSSPLKRKAEAKKMEQQLQELSAQLDQIRADKQRLSTALDTLEERLKDIRNRIAEADFQIELLQKEWDGTSASLANDREENLLYQQDIEIQQTYISAFSKELIKTEQQLAEHGQVNSKSAEELERIKADLDEKRREYDIRLERVRSQQEQLDMKAQELENLNNNMAQFMEVKKSYEQSVNESKKLQARLQADIKQQGEIVQKSSQMSIEQKRLIEEIQAAYEQQQKIHSQQSEGIEELRRQRGPLLEDYNRLDEEIRLAEMRILRLEMECEAALKKWEEKYADQDPGDYERPMTGAELRRCKQEAELLKQEIEQLGPVDMESISEYRELNERLEFLQQQSSDILEARESLENLLQETEKIMAKNFSQFLQLANERFKRTCQEIVGGGEAALLLEKDGDYMSAGVDIEIKMPGKRNQSLNLLSGGERALTCIAFIFSLLRLRPAPFCLLDEIDAALDETNLSRFTEFLKGMAKEIQFIVITHRQSTIEAGNSLFGVTMPQNGVSAVLSLNLEESIELAV